MSQTVLLNSLAEVKRRVRLLSVIHGFGLLLAAAMLLLLATVLLDYILNLAPAPRLVLMIASLGAVGYVGSRYLIRPILSKLRLTDIAGRIEQTFPIFDDRLRSTIDFAGNPSVAGKPSDESDAMKRRVMAQATEMAGQINLTSVVRPRPAFSALGGGLAAIVLCLIFAAAAGPEILGAAMSRLLTPFNGHAWPKRTMISVVGNIPSRVPAGTPVEVRIKLVKGDKPSAKAIIYYQYEENGPVEQEMMNRNADGTYSANIDATIESGKSAGMMTMWMKSGDDNKQLPQIQVVPPLTIKKVEAVVMPPKYADLPPVSFDLAAATATVTEGSSVDLNVSFSHPLSSGQSVHLASAGADAVAPDIKWQDVAPGALQATGHFMAKQAVRFKILGTDPDGFSNTGIEEFQVLARPDQLPTVQFEKPVRNEEALSIATIGLQGVAEDDFGIKLMDLMVRRLGDNKAWTIPLVADAKAAADSVQWIKVDSSGDRLRFRMNWDWDLAQLEGANLKAGDQLEFYLRVQDNYQDDQGKPHNPPYSESGRLHLTIISLDQLTQQLADQLSQLREQVDATRKQNETLRAGVKNLQQDTQNKPALDRADRALINQIAGEQSAAAGQTKQIADKLNELLARIQQNTPNTPSANSVNGQPTGEAEQQALRELAANAAEAQRLLNNAAENPMKDAVAKLTQLAQQQGGQNGQNPQNGQPQNPTGDNNAGDPGRQSQQNDGNQNSPKDQNADQQNPASANAGQPNQAQQPDNQSASNNPSQQGGQQQQNGQQQNGQPRPDQTTSANPSQQGNQQQGNPRQGNQQQGNQQQGNQQQGNQQQSASANQQNGGQQQQPNPSANGNPSQQQQGDQQRSASANQQNGGQQNSGQQNAGQQQRNQSASANPSQQGGQQQANRQGGQQQQQGGQQQGGQQQASRQGGQQQSGQQQGNQQQSGQQQSASANQQSGGQQQQNQSGQQQTAQASDRNNALQQTQQQQAAASEQLQQAMDKMGTDAGLSKFLKQVSNLLDAQRKLSQQTAQTGKDTLGKDVSQLTDQEKKDLQNLAQQQQDLAKQTDQAMQQMNDSSQKQQRTDPSSSQALQQAAQTGQQQNVSGNMQQAGQAAQQNQQANAQQAQRQAELGLMMMVRQLKEAENRHLAELMKQLDTAQQLVADLLSQQGSHNLDNLMLQGGTVLADAAKADPDLVKDLIDYSGRDPQNLGQPTPLETQIALQEQTERNTRNIVAVVQALPEGADPAADLTRAAQRMSRAATFLQDSQLPQAYEPPQVEALAALESAKTSLDKQSQAAQQRMQDQQKETLRQQFVQIRDEQAKINDQTKSIDAEPRTADGQLGHTARAKLGILSDQQTNLAKRTAKLDDDLAAVGSIAYTYANDDITAKMNAVGTTLGKFDAGTAAQQPQTRIVRELDAMIDNLAIHAKQSQFSNPRNQQQQPRQPGQPGQPQPKPPQLPPEAEIRLIQAMQKMLNDDTKDADTGKSGKSAVLDLGKRQGDLRKMLDDILKKASEGKTTLGDEPDNKDTLPEEATNEDLDLQELKDTSLNAKPDAKDISDDTGMLGIRMARARQRLALNADPGSTTQKIQDRIIIEMDGLASMAQQQQMQAQRSRQRQPGQRPQRQGQPQPGQPQGNPGNVAQNRPNQDQQNQRPRDNRGGGNTTGLTTENSNGDINQLLDSWGKLSPRQRSAVLEGSTDQTIQKFKDFVDAYYRTLALKATQPQ